MTQLSARGANETRASCDELLEDGEWSPARCAVAALAALQAHAGHDLRVTSFSLEMTPSSACPGEEVVIRARTDKRTPTVAFMAVEATCASAVAFTARGLFNLRRG